MRPVDLERLVLQESLDNKVVEDPREALACLVHLVFPVPLALQVYAVLPAIQGRSATPDLLAPLVHLDRPERLDYLDFLDNGD